MLLINRIKGFIVKEVPIYIVGENYTVDDLFGEHELEYDEMLFVSEKEFHYSLGGDLKFIVNIK